LQSAGPGKGLAAFDPEELFGAALAATPFMKKAAQSKRQGSIGSDGNDPNEDRIFRIPRCAY
jgi:hypothetical protein